MTRNDYPTRPEGMSSVNNHLILIWMEVGEHAVYQIGRRAKGATAIYLRTTQVIRPLISEYNKGLVLKVALVCEIYGNRQITPALALRPPRVDRDVDDLLSGRTSPPSIPPPPRAPARTERIPLDFVSIETILAHPNRKRVRVRQEIKLPPLFPDNAWCLELGFANVPGMPRIVRPSAENIIPPGF